MEDPRVERTTGGRRVQRTSRWAWAATIGASALVGLLVGVLVLLPAINRGTAEKEDAGSARPIMLPAMFPVTDAGAETMPTIDLVNAVEPDSGARAEADDAGNVAEVNPPDDTPKDPRPFKRHPPPRPGKVSVRVNPWAEVIYNGKNLGPTPLPGPIEVPPGIATFTLRNKQLGVTRKVSVKVLPGAEVVLKTDLFKKER